MFTRASPTMATSSVSWSRDTCTCTRVLGPVWSSATEELKPNTANPVAASGSIGVASSLWGM